jgi:hypothetical protein
LAEKGGTDRAVLHCDVEPSNPTARLDGIDAKRAQRFVAPVTICRSPEINGGTLPRQRW